MPQILRISSLILAGLLLLAVPFSAAAQSCNRYGGSVYAAPAYPVYPAYSAPYSGYYSGGYSAPAYGYGGYGYYSGPSRGRGWYERHEWREHREHEWREHERREHWRGRWNR